MSFDSTPFRQRFGAEHIYLLDGMWQREYQLENSDQFEHIVLIYVNTLGYALQRYGLSPRKLRIPPFPHFSFQIALTRESIFLILGQSASAPIRYGHSQDLRQVTPTPTLESVIADCEQNLGWESCLGVSFSPTILTNQAQRDKEIEKEADTLATQFAVQATQREVDNAHLPPSEGKRPQHDLVLPRPLVEGTRGYIEKVVDQINGTYENGCYDACAVMIRRLIETLIIEAFEHHNIADKIKTPTGDFFYLSDLITHTLKETKWNLGRNAKQALPKLKSVGDLSAHSRRYNAHRYDIDKIIHDLRISTQELIYLASFK